jgi:hypothetical protein
LRLPDDRKRVDAIFATRMSPKAQQGIDQHAYDAAGMPIRHSAQLIGLA